MTETITFVKDCGDYVASTGERIGFYKGTELYGRGSTGWYITETNGDFRGIKFDTLADAKFYLVRRNNRNSEQFSQMLSAKVERVIGKVGA